MLLSNAKGRNSEEQELYFMIFKMEKEDQNLIPGHGRSRILVHLLGYYVVQFTAHNKTPQRLCQQFNKSVRKPQAVGNQGNIYLTLCKEQNHKITLFNKQNTPMGPVLVNITSNLNERLTHTHIKPQIG